VARVSTTTTVPEVLPLLARGRHRTPRSGACFMELASYLAGERWSDAPRCTDPHLAGLARMVNDTTSDAARPALAPMVPSVVGTRGLPAGFAVDLALLAVTHSLSISAVHHQRALAVGTLRLLEMGGGTPERVAAARAALQEVPDARRWAREFLRATTIRSRHSPAAALVEVSVTGIATACVPDGDARLRALLADAINLARATLDVGPAPELEPASWRGRVRVAV
jgi:hypothetical protein